MPLKPPDFDQWFAASAGKDPDGVHYDLHQVTGWLWLPSGRVVTGEFITGLDDPDEAAFVQTVPPGGYAVSLLIEDYPVRSGPGAGTGDTIGYVAAARIVVRDEPSATWEMAVQPGQDASDLDDESFFGYPVDGGTAYFTDAQTLRALDNREIPAAHGEDWMVFLSDDIDDSPESLAVLTDPSRNEAPIVVGFSTGGGDGHYCTWVGRNAAGDITCFATDFMLGDAQPAG